MIISPHPHGVSPLDAEAAPAARNLGIRHSHRHRCPAAKLCAHPRECVISGRYWWNVPALALTQDFRAHLLVTVRLHFIWLPVHSPYQRAASSGFFGQGAMGFADAASRCSPCNIAPSHRKWNKRELFRALLPSRAPRAFEGTYTVGATLPSTPARSSTPRLCVPECDCVFGLPDALIGKSKPACGVEASAVPTKHSRVQDALH